MKHKGIYFWKSRALGPSTESQTMYFDCETQLFNFHGIFSYQQLMRFIEMAKPHIINITPTAPELTEQAVKSEEPSKEM